MSTRPGHGRERSLGAEPTAELLAGLRQRNETALAELYDHFGGLVYTLAVRILGDRELAQEVLQDVFLRCWERATTFDAARGTVAAWLLGITRNRAIDRLRDRQHQARLREQLPLSRGETAGAFSQADMSETVAVRQTIRAALDALPLGQRQAIELAYYGGLTQAEIARVAGVPLGTVKTRMRAGLDRLRELLQPLFADEAAEEGPGRRE